MKFLLKSKTIVGIIVGILPALLPAIGITFSVDDGVLINNVADLVVQLAAACLAVYGRFTATDKLTVRV
jgi:uncharacterized membrane protein (DUF441 family)